jgi:hypothetical protein
MPHYDSLLAANLDPGGRDLARELDTISMEKVLRALDVATIVQEQLDGDPDDVLSAGPHRSSGAQEGPDSETDRKQDQAHRKNYATSSDPRPECLRIGYDLIRESKSALFGQAGNHHVQDEPWPSNPTKRPRALPRCRFGEASPSAPQCCRRNAKKQ